MFSVAASGMAMASNAAPPSASVIPPGRNNGFGFRVVLVAGSKN